MNILMMSAENGALAGAKVGGLGDVVREAPLALAGKDCAVSVVAPSYGFLHHRQGASPVRPLSFRVYGAEQHALLYEVQAQPAATGVRHYVIDHPIFAWRPDGSRADGIYCIDPPEAPFATDATRFAFFGAAVAEGIRQGVFGTPDVLHLHDWH